MSKKNNTFTEHHIERFKKELAEQREWSQKYLSIFCFLACHISLKEFSFNIAQEEDKRSLKIICTSGENLLPQARSECTWHMA